RAAVASRSNSKPSIAGIPMSDMTQSTFANASSLRNACAEVNRRTVCPADSNRFSSDSSTRSSSSITATAHSLTQVIQERAGQREHNGADENPDKPQELEATQGAHKHPR